FDTVLAIYSGSSVGSLSPVVSNDDVGSGLQSSLTFSAIAGVIYRIAVDGYTRRESVFVKRIYASGIWCVKVKRCLSHCFQLKRLTT
ncbi:MAG: hypothetical protein L0287_08690, partial [Anaerolineae bacterium]|nr:hypothetical protein [Anaerolineae bacterium]